MIWLAALLTGMGGSLHCLGMCGPIALALPANAGPRFYLDKLVYHSGRIFSYAVLGSVMGLFGQGLYLAGLQQTISLAAGALILFLGIGLIHFRGSFPGAIRKQFNKLMQKDSYGAMLGLGMLNGVLPCGLVYIALAGSVTTQNWLYGAGYMALFGLGTLPMMLIVSLAPGLLSSGLRSRVKGFLPYLSVLIGILFVFRGLGLGIPYLSPGLNHQHSRMECCEEHRP